MNKPTILIIEDEKDMQFALKMQLESFNFNILTANDGQEGLEKARVKKPNLILLDLMLPKVDGYKVCGLLKGDKRYNKLPIIMLTARCQKEDEKLGFELGADAYFNKTFEIAELHTKIKELLKIERK